MVVVMMRRSEKVERGEEVSKVGCKLGRCCSSRKPETMIG